MSISPLTQITKLEFRSLAERFKENDQIPPAMASYLDGIFTRLEEAGDKPDSVKAIKTEAHSYLRTLVNGIPAMRAAALRSFIDLWEAYNQATEEARKDFLRVKLSPADGEEHENPFTKMLAFNIRSLLPYLEDIGLTPVNVVKQSSIRQIFDDGETPYEIHSLTIHDSKKFGEFLVGLKANNIQLNDKCKKELTHAFQKLIESIVHREIEGNVPTREQFSQIESLFRELNISWGRISETRTGGCFRTIKGGDIGQALIILDQINEVAK